VLVFLCIVEASKRNRKHILGVSTELFLQKHKWKMGELEKAEEKLACKLAL